MSADLFADPSVDVRSGIQTLVMKDSAGYVIFSLALSSFWTVKSSDLITQQHRNHKWRKSETHAT
jgi:hypothetical protein